jgi:organic radical activating enzyme
MLFSRQSAFALARGLLGLRRSPLYVQYYITSRCNLTCKQCNIIYANADVREATTSETELIAENLKRIGVAIVLLTGGEPFVRRDLPQQQYQRALIRSEIQKQLDARQRWLLALDDPQNDALCRNETGRSGFLK